MLQYLCPLQQIIVCHFFEPLMDDKNLIIEAQVVKALLVLQMLDSIQAFLHQHCWCMPLPHFFLRSLFFRIKSSRFIRSLFHSSLALWSFLSAKSCLLCSSSPWSMSLLKTKLVPLKTNALTTAPLIVTNNDAIYFLPKMISNQPTPYNQKCNS